MYNNIEKYYPGILFFVKAVILVLAYRLISDRVLEDRSYLFFLENLGNRGIRALPLALLLLSMTALNWYTEVSKWQALTSRIMKISFWEALKQSLSSLTVSLVTPNRIGEYGAKAMYFARENRAQVLFCNFVGNFSQMSITVVFGLLGVWVADGQISGLDFVSISLSGAWLLLAAAGVTLLLATRFWKRLYPRVISMLRTIPGTLLLNVWGLSVLKYLVFSHQFYFLLFFLGVELDYAQCMSLIAISYMISSLIPGFLIFDWLVKGSVAVLIFGRFGVDEMQVLSVTSLMWLLNFGLPSLLGVLYVITFRRPRLAAIKSKAKA